MGECHFLAFWVSRHRSDNCCLLTSHYVVDEMGLGFDHSANERHGTVRLIVILQTLQTTGFMAYLCVRVKAPFLTVCPLSVLHNWMYKFKRFPPKVSFSAWQHINAKLKHIPFVFTMAHPRNELSFVVPS